MKDRCVKAISEDGLIRIRAIDATETVREAQRRQASLSAASAGMGRVLVATLLLAADIKDDAKITVKFAGDGPAGKVIADANGQLQGRVMIDQPKIGLDLNAEGKIDVRGALGSKGTLSVIKDLALAEPFVGQVAIVSGEVAEDFAYYLAASEQRPSAVGLGVLVNADETINKAGGWLIEVMPGATEASISQLEAAIAGAPPVSKMLQDGYSPEKIIATLAQDFPVKVLSIRPVSYHCPCSKESFAKGLATLPKADLEAMIVEDVGAETVCHFCNATYQFNQDELTKIMEEAIRKDEV